MMAFFMYLAVAAALYTDSFVLKMIGIPVCLISTIGCGFWISSIRKDS
jgi:hypothetical protein